MTVLESDYLVPDATFFVMALVCLAVFAVLVLWPLVDTVARQQWGYLLAVLLLGPVGGLIWLLRRRRTTARPGGGGAADARKVVAER